MKKLRILLASLVLIVTSFPLDSAQEVAEPPPGGSDASPTGVSGIFNGSITTGCSYDAWTYNFRREIVDIDVPGCVSAYGLKFTRTYNSKDLKGWEAELLPSGALGNSMGLYWRHSYSTSVGSWVDYDAPLDSHSGEGFVFPDGRVIPHESDLDCAPYGGRLPPTGELDDTRNTGNWLMSDGGKVHLGGVGWGYFIDARNASIVGIPAVTITDPYGQVITIEHDNSCQGCGRHNRITKVTDVGSQKYLWFTYYPPEPGDPNYLRLLWKVEAREPNGTLIMSAEYHYQHRPPPVPDRQATDRFLDWVKYSDGTRATYQWDFGDGHTAYIAVADDPHYAGPMRHIEYHLADHLTGEYKQWPSTLVSRVYIENDNDNDGIPGTRTRTETRGDGVTRTLTYKWDYPQCIGSGGGARSTVTSSLSASFPWLSEGIRGLRRQKDGDRLLSRGKRVSLYSVRDSKHQYGTPQDRIHSSPPMAVGDHNDHLPRYVIY